MEPLASSPSSTTSPVFANLSLLDCLPAVLFFAIPGAIFWTRPSRLSSSAATTGTTTGAAWELNDYGRLTVAMWWIIHISHHGIFEILRNNSNVLAQECFTLSLVFLTVWLYSRMIMSLILPLWDQLIAERKAHTENEKSNLKDESKALDHHNPSSSSSSSAILSTSTIEDLTIPKTVAIESKHSDSTFSLYPHILACVVGDIASSVWAYYNDPAKNSVGELIRKKSMGFPSIVLGLLSGSTIAMAIVSRQSAYSVKTKSQHWFMYGKLMLVNLGQFVLTLAVDMYSRKPWLTGHEREYPLSISMLMLVSAILLTSDFEKEFLSDISSSAV